MEAKELMVGNMALWSDPFVHEEEWNEIKIDAKDILNIQNNVTKTGVFKPIELTEEWYIKWGYECWQEFVNHMCEISDYPIDDDMNYWNELLNGMKVHKVQNLFYELTGEELKAV